MNPAIAFAVGLGVIGAGAGLYTVLRRSGGAAEHAGPVQPSDPPAAARQQPEHWSEWAEWGLGMAQQGVDLYRSLA